MAKEIRKYNWEPGPEDPNDFQAMRHVRIDESQLPKKFVLGNIPVYNQGSLGSCTANSAGICYRYEWYQMFGDYSFDPSRLFLYYVTRDLEGYVNTDRGAFIRNTFKAMNKFGLAAEEDMPYNIKRFADKPSTSAYENAFKNLVVRYTSVKRSASEIKRILASGAAVSFGFQVYESFDNGNFLGRGGVIPFPVDGEKNMGGHAVTVIGYDDEKQLFLIQNSWGENWGLRNETFEGVNLGGKFWMSYSFIQSNLCSDFWCIDEIKARRDSNEMEDLIRRLFNSPREIKTLKDDTVFKLAEILGIDNERRSSRKTKNKIIDFLFK